MLLFGQLLDKLGLLFISNSGHTGRKVGDWRSEIYTVKCSKLFVQSISNGLSSKLDTITMQ